MIKKQLYEKKLPAIHILSLETIEVKRNPPKVKEDGTLDLPPVIAPGFEGYLVNLIFLPQEHANLRKTLWYHILGRTMVFSTTADCRNCIENTSEEIKTRNKK